MLLANLLHFFWLLPPTDKAVDLFLIGVAFHYNTIAALCITCMASDYVIYGVDYEEKILDGVDGEEMRLALISHAKNKMFTSEQGRFKVVTY